MQWLLILFGWIFTGVMLAVILVPYLRGRSDLLTAWNLFLLGSANFVGYAAVLSGWTYQPYAQYEESDYIKFVLGAILLYSALFVAYYGVKFPRRVAGRRLRMWPGTSNGLLALVLPLCAILSFFSLFHVPIQGVAQALILLGVAASVFGVVFALVLWLRQPVNPILLWVFLGMGALGLVVSLAQGTGRRPLLNLLLGIIIAWYWLRLRYKSALSTVVKSAAVAAVLGVFLSGYSAIRHRSKAGIDVQYAIESIQMLPSAVLGTRGNFEGVLGGDSVESSLLAIYRYPRIAETQPFWTLWFLAVQPIPRALWPEKPESLGTILPRDSGMWRTGYVNLGPGIVGHGFHEGGFHMLLFYGLLFGCCFRFFDELLVRQPDNPYLLAIFASFAGDVVGFSRGDIAVFSVNIVAGLLTGLVLRQGLRMLFGTGIVYPSDDDVAAMGIECGMVPAGGETNGDY